MKYSSMPTPQNHQHEQLLKLGYECLQKGDYQQLGPICSRLAEDFSKQLDSWILLARFGIQSNNLNYAEQALKKAQSIGKEDHTLLALYGWYYLSSGDTVNLEKLLERAKNLPIESAQILAELATVSYRAQRLELSKSYYLKAIKLSPENSNYNYSLAATEQYLGNIDEAVKYCEKAIQCYSNNHEAIFLRSNLKKQTLDQNHFEEIESFIEQQPEKSISRTMGCYALAKEYEDCKRFELSFKWRQQGAELYRRSFNYNVNDDIQFMQRIAEVYQPDLFSENSQSNLGEGAIFILGLPRTGSTLVERIVSSHTEVSSAGELTHFPNLITKFLQQTSASNSTNNQDYVAMTKGFDFTELGKEYMGLCSSHTVKQKYFVDKFPQNALYTGLINLALPKAKIILVERDPMDVCYAIYKQLFTNIYEFSYDQNELAEYYIAHQQLMNHWKKCLSERLYVVRYEDLIADIETQSRDLIEFCNLGWQPQCLDFQANPQMSATASAVQVRKKLYSSSVGMWKNYQKELAPLHARLSNAGLVA